MLSRTLATETARDDAVEYGSRKARRSLCKELTLQQGQMSGSSLGEDAFCPLGEFVVGGLYDTRSHIVAQAGLELISNPSASDAQVLR